MPRLRAPLRAAWALVLLAGAAVLAGAAAGPSQQPPRRLQRQLGSAAPLAGAPPPAAACQVGAWGPFSACTRTGLNEWSHSRSRPLLKPGAACPALNETSACDPARTPRPAGASDAQQLTLAVVTAMPLAIRSALVDGASQLPEVDDFSAGAVPPADIAAGRALWESQASSYDRMTCLPFNGHSALLSGAAERGAGPQAALAAARRAAVARVTAARPRFDARRAAAAALAARDEASAAAGGEALAQLAWDGNLTLGARFATTGAMSGPEVELAADVVTDTMSGLMPWMVVQVRECEDNAWAVRSLSKEAGGPRQAGGSAPPTRRPPARPAAAAAAPPQEKLPPARALALDVAFDSTDAAVTFTGAAGSALPLLAAVEQPLMAAFGVAPPSAAEPGVATPLASLTVSGGHGVTELALGLGGAWSASGLSRRMGLPFELPDRLLALSGEPVLLYNAAPTVMYAATAVDLPAVGLARATATLNVRPGNQVTLQTYGPSQPIPHLFIYDDLELSALPDGGFAAAADGTLAGLPVSAAATIAPDGGVRFTMAASEREASVNAMVQTIFPPAAVPHHLAATTAGMAFARVTVTYANASSAGSAGASADGGGSGFSILATPSLDGAAGLTRVLGAVGGGVSDVALRSSPAGLALGVQEPLELQLPPPFASAGAAMLALAPDAADAAGAGDAALAGGLAAALRLPGVAAPVPLRLDAALPLTGAGPVSARLRGGALAPGVGFDKLNVVQFGPLSLDGAALAFAASVPRVDVQALAAALGAKVKLGAISPVLGGVRQTYAAKAVPALGVQPGMYLEGQLAFLDMAAGVEFELTPDGVAFAFAPLAASRVAGVLASAAAAIQSVDAPDATPQPAQAGAYLNDLLEAQRQLGAASGLTRAARRAPRAARPQAVDDLSTAQARAASASAAYDALRKRRAAEHASAADAFQAADAAAVAAQAAAFAELQAAKGAVASTQAEYAAATADALAAVEVAQGTAEELKAAYNANNSRCDSYAWSQANCAAAAEAWAAYQAAAEELAAASAALADVSGAAAAKLAAARAGLAAAQAAADGASAGPAWARRASAEARLAAAASAADATPGSAEAAAAGAANAALAAAQAAVAAALSSGTPEWRALAAASAGLDNATALVFAADAAAKAAPDERAAALSALSAAAAALDGGDLLRLNGLWVNFALRKDVTMLFVSYDLTVAGSSALGRFAIDAASGGEELKLALAAMLRNEAVAGLKAAHPDAAPFLACRRLPAVLRAHRRARTDRRRRARAPPQEPRTTTALMTFPGSGNTWVRHIIETLTGYHTSSVYCDKSLQPVFTAECDDSYMWDKSIAVKTHMFSCWWKRAVVVIRHPLRAIMGDYQRLRTGKSHTGVVDPKLWDWDDWYALSTRQCLKWTAHFQRIFGDASGETPGCGNATAFKVFFYEDLKTASGALNPYFLDELLAWFGIDKADSFYDCALANNKGHFARKLPSDHPATKILNDTETFRRMTDAGCLTAYDRYSAQFGHLRQPDDQARMRLL
ncbi:Wscd1 [Scenedesmus sp. PABB004]|nr:Wscd1 [Scenedesmus sp. PABB004]